MLFLSGSRYLGIYRLDDMRDNEPSAYVGHTYNVVTVSEIILSHAMDMQHGKTVLSYLSQTV